MDPDRNHPRLSKAIKEKYRYWRILEFTRIIDASESAPQIYDYLEEKPLAKTTNPSRASWPEMRPWPMVSPKRGRIGWSGSCRPSPQPRLGRSLRSWTSA